MDHEDPRASYGELTADDVSSIVFSRPLIGRSYHEEEVDAFLTLVEQTLRNPQAVGGLTAVEVDEWTFSKPPFGRRGYNAGEVDELLERVAQQLRGTGGQH
jgi:DivIVA domain-containing protein